LWFFASFHRFAKMLGMDQICDLKFALPFAAPDR
jgi:hypothetical protein